MEADSDIDLIMAGNTLSTAWITFNYPRIPVNMRKAIAYAMNYSYIIDVVFERSALRFPTYIPLGIAYANYSLDYPTFDRTYARNLLLTDATYAPICAVRGLTGASTDQDWLDVASSNPIESYNYTWNTGNTLREDTGHRLSFDLTYIGIELEVNGVAWGDLLDMLIAEREKLDLYMLGWGPDYIDPENYISPIWSNMSVINGGSYWEHDVQTLMDAGLEETDPVLRQQIYDDIQRLMVERDYPGMPLTTGINWDAWQDYIKGYISNPIGNVWFYPVYIEA